MIYKGLVQTLNMSLIHFK